MTSMALSLQLSSAAVACCCSCCAPPCGTVLVTDGFARADGPLGHADTGQLWLTPLPGGPMVFDNAMGQIGSQALGLALIDAGQLHVKVQATALVAAGTALVLSSDPAGMQTPIGYIYPATGSTWRLYDGDLSTFVVLGPAADGDVVAVGYDGANLYGWVNGVLRGTTPALIPETHNHTFHGALAGAHSGTDAAMLDTFSVTEFCTPELAAPTAPLTVAATPGNGQATVTWAAPTSDGGAPIIAYLVSVVGDDSQFAYWTGGPLSVTVPGLTNGTPVAFHVKAWNGAVNLVGDSPLSAASNTVTPTP